MSRGRTSSATMPEQETGPPAAPVGDLVSQLLDESQLVLICAPPGFGKTRLLHAAADGVRSRFGRAAMMFGRAQHRSAPSGAAEAILEAESQDTVVIDGLRGADVGAIVEAIGVRFPSKDAPRLWMALHHTREIAVARLLADRTARVFDWRCLKLSDAAVRAQTERVPLRFRKVVTELGGSWPAATSLLCRWAQEAATDEAEYDVPAILAASGLDAYIEEEVAPLLESDELDALVHASIADTIQIGFDRRGVTRSHIDQTILKASFKIGGLMERRGDVLSLNPALRHWLSIRFEELPRERQRESLAHAASDFALRGDLVVAARLYRGADRAPEIERLAKDSGSLLIWMTHGYPAIREIVEQAGEAVVQGSPTLKLMRCILLMKSGQIAEAQRLFSSVDDDDLWQDDEGERDREVVRAALSVYGCVPRESSELERFRAVVARSADIPDWRSLLSTLSCILDGQAARFDTAMASLIDARVHARNAKSHYNLLFLSLHETSIRLATGELKKARFALSDARKRWREGFSDDRGAETVLYALSASLEYELGQLSSARVSTRRSAYRMPDSEAWFDIYAAAYEPMARLAAADHGLGPCLEILADQRRRLTAQGLVRVAELLRNLGIVIAGERWLREEDHQSGWRFEDAVRPASPSTWQERETYTLAAAYGSMRNGRMDDAEETLRRALDESECSKLARSSLRLRLAIVALLLHRGDARASRELKGALLLGSELDARQVFQHSMTPALAGAIGRAAVEMADLPPNTARFIGSLNASSPKSGGNGDAVLSGREIEVLRALCDGSSDKVIGRSLGISEHGVRFHLKAVYRKFDVHNRGSAVHRARELGLIRST